MTDIQKMIERQRALVKAQAIALRDGYIQSAKSVEDGSKAPSFYAPEYLAKAAADYVAMCAKLEGMIEAQSMLEGL